MDIKQELLKLLERRVFNAEELVDEIDKLYKQDQALQLQQTGVSGCFSYKEALKFLELHTPIAVKPIKKSKYKFVNPFTSANARNIVIFSLATELSKNNKITAFDFLLELKQKSEWHNLVINDNALAGKMVEFAELYYKEKIGIK